jgi:hypothetical protein
MKKNFFLILLCSMSLGILSCQSQPQKDAQNMATDIQKMVKGNSGLIPTTTNGFMMTAKIDGREWKAIEMYPPDKAGQVAGVNNRESIALPYYDRRNFLARVKTKLGVDYGGVDMRLDDDIALYSAINGEMEITKSDDNMAEGKFHFIAKGFQSDKTVEVTDGLFRILFK